MQTVSKWGNSLAIRIPSAFAQKAGIDEGSEVEIKATSGRLVVSPARKKYRLAELVSAITPRNRHGETDWGTPVGRELW